MINSRKKGFTLVELVIVIAVVAILAAVLIPTFSSLVKKANAANDTVVAKNMNTALAEYSALNGKPENFEEVLTAIEEAGYVLANLNAKAGGNLYGWDEKNNQIVYLDQEGNVIYQNVEFVKNDVKFVVKSEVEKPSWAENFDIVDMSKPEGPKALKGALESGISVTLQNDVKDVKDLTIPAGSNVTLDLGSYTYTTAQLNAGGERQKSDYIRVEKGATLTITGNGGEFNGRGIMNNGGTLIIKSNVTINAIDYDGGGCIRNKPGGEVIVEGGTFNVNVNEDYNNSCDVPCVRNDGGKITINGGTFYANGYAYTVSNGSGTMIINGGTFKGSRGVISSNDGKITINDGTFEQLSNLGSSHVLYTSGTGVIEANKGTLIGYSMTSNTDGGTITISNEVTKNQK